MARAPDPPEDDRVSEAPVEERPVRTVEPVSVAKPSIANVCGVVGLLAAAASLLGFFPLLTGLVGVVLGVAGVILGSMAWSQARHTPAITNGTAIAGTLLSVLAVALAAISIALVGAEIRSLDATISELEDEMRQLTEQIESGAEDTADTLTDD